MQTAKSKIEKSYYNLCIAHPVPNASAWGRNIWTPGTLVLHFFMTCTCSQLVHSPERSHGRGTRVRNAGRVPKSACNQTNRGWCFTWSCEKGDLHLPLSMGGSRYTPSPWALPIGLHLVPLAVFFGKVQVKGWTLFPVKPSQNHSWSLWWLHALLQWIAASFKNPLAGIHNSMHKGCQRSAC